MEPSAFLSYTHDDDSDGSIRAFKERLEIGAKLILGKPFKIFFDRDDIAWGASWDASIKNSLNDTTFLIPIITPSYFNSAPCRHELRTFLEREGSLKKTLVLAVHYIDVPELDSKTQPADDLIAAVWKRQWVDWRHLREASLNPQKKQAYTDLAKKIRRAIPTVTGANGVDAASTPPPTAAAAAAAARKYACLIGCGTFDATMSLEATATPKQNVADLEQALSALPGAPFQTTTLVDPVSDDVRTALQRVAQGATADDFVLIYYTGVASVSAEDGVCLVATNSKPTLLESAAVPLSWVRRRITDTIAARNVVVVLDCGYRALPAGQHTSIADALQSDLGKGKGKCLITASTAIDTNPEQLGERNSPFTKWLVKGLTSWQADQNQDGVITLDEIYSYVTSEANADVLALKPKKWDFELAEPGRIEIGRRAKKATAANPSRQTVEKFPQLEEIKVAYSVKRLIPFLGDGIYGSGPLSAFALLGGMAERSQIELTSDLSIATAAEYLQVQLSTGRGDESEKQARADFLADFLEILQQQSKSPDVLRRAVHDVVITKMTAPWMMVSATYDDVLERRLAQAGQPFVVLSHVLRAEQPELRGKILVRRHGQADADSKWEISAADNILLQDLASDGSYRVIYKVLGSPFLNQVPDPELGIDTVVVTESDHTLFLSYLDNERTKVPAMFAKPFKIGAMLFLGYNLDVWHYRLVARVFGKAPGKAYAVRQPTSAIEWRFWRALGVDVMPTDPETFAATLLV